MLQLNQKQTDALTAGQWQAAMSSAIEHCRRYFQEVVAHLTDAELLQHLEHCFARGRAYDFTSQRDAYRFLNLALEFGWDFDTRIRHSWMRKRLLDPRLATPSERLEWLVKRCIHRLQIEEENLNKLRAFAPGEVPVNIYGPTVRDDDEYNPVQSILLFENYLPMKHSRCLQADEFISSDANSKESEHYADDEEQPLLVKKFKRPPRHLQSGMR
jgi:hypothetical protein